MNRWKSVMTAGAGVVALAGAAFAQSAKVEGGFDKPIDHAAGASDGGQSSMFLSSNDGDNTVEVKIENGKVVSAKVNGKEVPKDRIKRHDGRVDIVDEDGGVIQSFSVGQGGAGTFWRGEGNKGGQFFGPGQFKFDPGQFVFTPFGEAAEPPKVMLGVNMSEASDDDLADLKDVEAAIRIDHVIDDLPAAKAGLKEGDLVTAINGQKPATPEKLREVLKEKEAGDKVKLAVVHENGKQEIVTVELAEYDAEKLGIAAVAVEGFDPGQVNEEARKAFEEAMKAAPRFRSQGLAAPRAQGQGGAEGMRGLMLRAPEADQERVQTRLRELNNRLEAIDKRLSELDERLERLTTKLEKLVDRP